MKVRVCFRAYSFFVETFLVVWQISLVKREETAEFLCKKGCEKMEFAI